MDSDVVQLRTGTRLVTDFTDRVLQFCRNRGDGLCNVFVPHATAGVALIETGSGSESDLEEAIGRLLPRSDIYRHRHGSRGHGRDHLLDCFRLTFAHGASARRPSHPRYLAKRRVGGHECRQR